MTLNWIKMFNNRIKAKAKLYFDVDGESVTASEESLSDAVAKVNLFFDSDKINLITFTFNHSDT